MGTRMQVALARVSASEGIGPVCSVQRNTGVRHLGPRQRRQWAERSKFRWPRNAQWADPLDSVGPFRIVFTQIWVVKVTASRYRS